MKEEHETNRFEIGLVSVTFRPFSKAKVIETMKNAGLSLVEWGGDVHVPSADEGAIEEAVSLCRGNGIRTISYGSYYRCDDDEALQKRDLAAAIALKAPNIRVWAGKKGSADTTPEERKEVCRHIQTICDLAMQSGLTVSAEFHGGTLTDEYESAVRLYHEVERENFRLYWQPNQFRDDAYNRDALCAVMPYLSNVHVFTWRGHGRYPLAEGEAQWREYIDLLAQDEKRHALLLEFVCDDTAEQLYRDVEALRTWLRGY